MFWICSAIIKIGCNHVYQSLSKGGNAGSQILNLDDGEDTLYPSRW
jgi:hypothetical protein